MRFYSQNLAHCFPFSYSDLVRDQGVGVRARASGFRARGFRSQGARTRFECLVFSISCLCFGVEGPEVRFSMRFEHESDKCLLAHCFPFSYSDLVSGLGIRVEGLGGVESRGCRVKD